MQDFGQAWAYVTALTNDAENAVFNWRFINDRDKTVPAIKRRGTLAQVWQEACNWNSHGYGIFATVSLMDGTGDKLENVAATRAHVVDLDNLNAMQNLERAKLHHPAPGFAVQTSPGKAHVYWPLREWYRGNGAYRLIQRKLRQFYDGDKAVIDATRVLRVPGFLHQKGEPHLVVCYSLPGYGNPTTFAELEASLAMVNAPDDFGGRKPLGDAELAAPSAEWLWYALENTPVEGMSHPDFISFTAAYKQAGWGVADHDELLQRWLAWCERFGTESKGVEYNMKHWNSIEDTETGWKSLMRRNPAILAQMKFHGVKYDTPGAVPVPPMPQQTQPSDAGGIPSGEILTASEQQEYFKGCVFVSQFGSILTPKGQLFNSTQFNGQYGGKKFMIDGNGKITDEAWKAATRSTLWTVPKVDYIRFLPHVATNEIVVDELGRRGVNTFVAPNIIRAPGDVSPFLNHLNLILPVQSDQRIILDFIAHNAKFPGYKIPWAPLLQSTEGAGKGIFKLLMRYLVGSSYFHSPNAQELVESGSKFNAWMRAKLFILVDEIRTDERRDMIEVLKPMITEEEIEIQAKGHDQSKEDNFANWWFLSNYKDAVPVNKNSRRFAILYSVIQSVEDLEQRAMTDGYFNWLMNWFKSGGNAALAHYFAEYPIERGALPHRAPLTSSHAEAIRQSRTPAERAVCDAIDAGLPGFRGGWVSAVAASNAIKAAGVRALSAGAIERLIEGLGYRAAGRAPRAYFSESATERPMLFNRDTGANVAGYGYAQGYE